MYECQENEALGAPILDGQGPGGPGAVDPVECRAWTDLEIGHRLRAMYADLTAQPLPDRLNKLLSCVDEANRALLECLDPQAPPARWAKFQYRS